MTLMSESEPIAIRVAGLALYFGLLATMLSLVYQAEALAMVLLPFIASVVYLVRRERSRQPMEGHRLR
jgi:hypothetical protein